MVLAITPPGAFDRVARLPRIATGGFAFRETLQGTLRATGATPEIAVASLAATNRDASPDDHGGQNARRHARALLEEMQAVQRDLLRRGVAPAALRRLAALAADLAPEDLAAVDPELADICAGIVLRARVEAAKLQQRGPVLGRPPASHRPTEPDERKI